jgi:hypothetical protein
MATAEYTVSDKPFFALATTIGSVTNPNNDGSVAVGTGSSAARGGTTSALVEVGPSFVNSMATGVGIAGTGTFPLLNNFAAVDFMGGMGDPTITLDSETMAYAESGESYNFGP